MWLVVRLPNTDTVLHEQYTHRWLPTELLDGHELLGVWHACIRGRSSDVCLRFVRGDLVLILEEGGARSKTTGGHLFPFPSLDTIRHTRA